MTEMALPKTVNEAKEEFSHIAAWFNNLNQMINGQAPSLKERGDMLRGYLLGKGVAQAEIDQLQQEIFVPPAGKPKSRSTKKVAATKRTAPQGK